jgi:hypothetical protein
MFLQRFYDYDERKFPRGFYFNFLGLVRILKFNVATVMQKPDYILIVELFGREFVHEIGAPPVGRIALAARNKLWRFELGERMMMPRERHYERSIRSQNQWTRLS